MGTVSPTNPSVTQLIERLDAATAHGDSDAVCAAVKQVLIEEIGSGRFQLPPEFERTNAEGYARRLLHKSDDYAVVVMIWAPEQGTPIHDHDNKWCVECVYSGTIRVVSYDLLGEPDDEIVGFREAEEVRASKGMAGSLIPPFDYHVIHNPHDEVAITVHVYGGEMFGCSAYTPLENGKFQRERRQLTYSD